MTLRSIELGNTRYEVGMEDDVVTCRVYGIDTESRKPMRGVGGESLLFSVELRVLYEEPVVGEIKRHKYKMSRRGVIPILIQQGEREIPGDVACIMQYMHNFDYGALKDFFNNNSTVIDKDYMDSLELDPVG